jgi:3-carboxy-cis,cis-muconate cycloisomerase
LICDIAMLIDCLGTTEEFTTLFSDRSVLEAMLRFESALARAQARLGIIPQTAAASISAVTADKFDAAAIGCEARRSASVAIPFVQVLRSQAETDFVHWGATSQDLIDTALVLLLVQARSVLRRGHERLSIALRKLSEEHKDTVMLARTLMQPASPITFGYKVALWYGGLARSWRTLSLSFVEGLLLQFGGASGTLAAYSERGPALAAELANELKLALAPPWHTERDRPAALVANLGIYTGVLGKIARDVTLLMQFEVGEVSETGGGSSAMPHKRNPSNSSVALAASVRVPALVAAYLGAMVQEHERAAGAWQSEWQTVGEIASSAGSALSAVAGLFESLKVHPERMRANLDATRGTVLSERAAMLLTPQLGREAAQRAVVDAIEKVHERRQPLENVLNINLGSTEEYLGSSEVFRRKLLEDVE